MILKSVTLDQLFFLYCALIYNNNETIQLPIPQLKVAKNIKKILEEKRLEKIEMPDHRYQYLLSILGSANSKLKNNIKPKHLPIISYIQNLSKIEELQNLLYNEKVQVEKHLDQYGDSFQKVTILLNKTFSFESKYSTIYVTRNFGKSGMFIPLRNEGYLILGNISDKPNIRNLIHELLHAQLEEVNIRSTSNIKRIIDELPDKIYDNYKRPHAIVEESLVRALVVYLTKKSSYFEEEELSEQDLDLIIPKLYLKKLEEDNKEVFSKDYLENLEI